MNNFLAMPVLTQEQQKIIADTCNVMVNRAYSSEHSQNLRVVAQIALAALTAKPVAWISSGEFAILSRLKQHSAVEVGLFNAQRFSDDTPLFTSTLIPAGWKIVPIEPTERMVIAGFESEPDESFSTDEEREAYEAMSGCQQAAHKARVCYAAMLAAAPASPGEKSQPYGWVAEYPTVPAGIGGMTYSFHDNRADAQEEADAYDGHVVEVIRR